MKPKHCDIEVTLYGGNRELYLTFSCPDSYDGCAFKTCHEMPPPEDRACVFYNAYTTEGPDSCRSHAARLKALETLKRRVDERLKTMRAEAEVEE